MTHDKVGSRTSGVGRKIKGGKYIPNIFPLTSYLLRLTASCVFVSFVSLPAGRQVCAFFMTTASAQDIRDVKLPVDLPPDFFRLFFGVGLIAAVGLAALAYFLKKKFKGKPAKPVVPPRPPWEVALERLRQLHAEDLPAQGKIKEFYFRLSDIIRHYIEDRFAINAPDMTTEEFLASLSGRPALSAAQKDALKEFLNCCDMVKFAKYDSNVEEMDRSFDLAQRFIQDTKKIEQMTKDNVK